MVFSANDSPLAGKAGKAVTGRTIGQRLAQEAEASVSLRVKAMPGGHLTAASSNCDPAQKCMPSGQLTCWSPSVQGSCCWARRSS